MEIDAIFTEKANWEKCFNLLKPGGYLILFGGEKPYRKVVEIENTGFEIRDSIAYLGKELRYIAIARKPFKGTLVDNVLTYGVGGINIDECRIEHNEPQKTTTRKPFAGEVFNTKTCGFDSTKNHTASAAPEGRFPANLILSYDENDKDEVCGGFPYTKSAGGKVTNDDFSKYNDSMMNRANLKEPAERIDRGYIAPCDSSSASRYFYNAKTEKDLVTYLMKMFIPKFGTLMTNMPRELFDKSADYEVIQWELD